MSEIVLKCGVKVFQICRVPANSRRAGLEETRSAAGLRNAELGMQSGEEGIDFVHPFGVPAVSQRVWNIELVRLARLQRVWAAVAAERAAGFVGEWLVAEIGDLDAGRLEIGDQHRSRPVEIVHPQFDVA